MANIFKTAYGAVFKAFEGFLKRSGVNAGGTAGYPRVQIHSFTEGAPMDKGSAVRSLTISVESTSNRSLAEAVQMAQDNLPRLIVEGDMIDDGFKIIDIIPNQLQDLVEISDTQPILYHIIQQFIVYIEKI